MSNPALIRRSSFNEKYLHLQKESGVQDNNKQNKKISTF